MKTLNTDNMTPTEIARAARKIAVDWVKITYPDLKITDANPRYSDIVAMDNNGNEYCFEVKGTTKPTGSFGAATLTECEYAIKSIDRYWFLLVYIGGDGVEHSVKPYSLRELLPYMSIPPFKINFNITPRKARKGKLNTKQIEKLIRLYDKVKTK